MTAELVLVTGSTGFVGHVLADELANSFLVRRVVRNAAGHASVPDQVVVPDLVDREAVRRALAGVETVVHAAGRAHVMRRMERDTDFYTSDVVGTQVLCEEAVRAGVRRFVFISSTKALGNYSMLSDATPAKPVDQYGRSKLAAEDAVRRILPASIHSTTLRPPLIYGPGVKGNMLTLLRLVDAEVPLPLGSVQNSRSMIFVRNLAHAVIGVLNTPSAGGETFLVSDGRDLSTPDIVRGLATALRRRPRLFNFPVSVIKTAAKMSELVDRASPFGRLSLMVDRLVSSQVVDSSRIWDSIGTPPPFGPEEGFLEMATWHRRSSTRSANVSVSAPIPRRSTVNYC
jgi:nucleoside-diphosphate-sugar epimerase